MTHTVIRRGVFETNSSSTHSISIDTQAFDLDRLAPDVDGIVRIFPGEFGWEEEQYTDAATKASYCYTHAASGYKPDEELLNRLRVVIQNETRCPVEFAVREDEYYPYGHIDHQSSGVCAPAFESLATLRAFIFNRRSVLVTDNDNH